MTLSQRAMTRGNLSCAVSVEVPFNGSGFGSDVCAYCAVEGSETDQNLRRQYKTVLPLCKCNSCRMFGKLPIVQRPYGRLAKKYIHFASFSCTVHVCACLKSPTESEAMPPK